MRNTQMDAPSDIVRLTAEQRINVILNAAVRIANDSGLTKVTHKSVAKRCVVKTSEHTVKRYFPTKTNIWCALLNEDHCKQSVIDEAQKIGVNTTP